MIKIVSDRGICISDAKARLNLSLPLIKQKAKETYGE